MSVNDDDHGSSSGLADDHSSLSGHGSGLWTGLDGDLSKHLGIARVATDVFVTRHLSCRSASSSCTPSTGPVIYLESSDNDLRDAFGHWLSSSRP